MMNAAHVLFTMMMMLQMKIIYAKIDNRNKCASKLLNDPKVVPDSAFSATSYFTYKNKLDKQMNFSPKAARESYDKDSQEFAWCPENKVATFLKDYLEIDLGRLTVINYVQTKGRFAQGAGKEYSPFYKIKYKREDKGMFKDYKKIDKATGLKDTMKGPNDAFLDAYETLDPPIITRWIRIYPYSYDFMRVCLKIQLFGCIYTGHVMEYRIRQGSILTSPIVKLPAILSTIVQVFQDSSFDGQNDQGLLVNGIGRLADNKTGGQFLLDPLEAQQYVGWNRKGIGASDDQSVSLFFRFDSVRNFSSVRLYTYDNQSLEITPPLKLEAKFSLYGETFPTKSTIVASVPESKQDHFSDTKAPWIQFNMHHKIGQFLQLKLFFNTDWIVMSEIDFFSELAVGYETRTEEVNLQIPDRTTVKYDQPLLSDNSQNNIESSVSKDVVYMLSILLCLLLGIIIAITIFWCIMRHRRNKRKKDIKKSELAFHSQNPFKTLSMIPHNQGGFHLISNSYISEYTPGVSARPSVVTKDQCMFSPNLNNQNCMTLPKSSVPINESSIYTSIPGSDNDSSVGTDYMAASAVNSSHTYNQIGPLSESVTDLMMNQPQIIGNPLVDYLDQQKYYVRPPNNGLFSYEPDLVAMTNSPYHSNMVGHNAQPFTGSITYQPPDYTNSVDKNFFSIPNKYRNSPLKQDPLLR